jgi:hypothetical protein
VRLAYSESMKNNNIECTAKPLKRTKQFWIKWKTLLNTTFKMSNSNIAQQTHGSWLNEEAILADQ